VPESTAWAAKWTACWDDPHCLSMVTPGTLSGSPADSQAFLAMSRVCGPICETHPRIDSGAVDQRAQGVRPEIDRVDSGQGSVPPADRGAHRADDERFRH
jgi:hypothetical protein